VRVHFRKGKTDRATEWGFDMMLQNNEQEFDLKRIQEVLNISDKSVANCPITEEELRKIYYDYIEFLPYLEKLRIEILGSLNERMTGKVHSIRSRVKQPDHLIGKIIRGVYRNPAKYHRITVENYKKIITDLIGVRIIILDKRDWRGVHSGLMTMYRNLPERYARRPKDILVNYDKYADELDQASTLPECSYHAERPVAYIASEDDRKLYQDEFIKLDNSKAHYRSVHYIIRYKNVYFEMQMRSLFEEGWLEFDHRMKYPNDQFNKKKQEYISILSNLANAADQLISYYVEEDFVSADSSAEEMEMYRPYKPEDLTEQGLEERMKELF
jgi:ppGpp synthetase/RelA/SpoT-type nucleotidyltranferase